MLPLCVLLAAGLIAGATASMLVSRFVVVPLLLLVALRLLRVRLSETNSPMGLVPCFPCGWFGPSFPRSF